ncbi:MAG: signal recognition particle-docking protein FtsY [Chlamydiales bacterium]
MFGFFKKILSPFAKKIRALFTKAPDDAAFEHLEQIFYEADLGAAASAELVEKIRALYKKKPTLATDEILAFVKQDLLQGMLASRPILNHKPHVILLVGVNGSGKTTTLAKLASHYTRQGKKVLVAAGDTFRAAAIEQIGAWVQQVGAELIKSQPNSDPSGVAFDAVAAGIARGSDIVLIDTAGRLQTKTDLMHELAKVRRVCQKQLPDAPHEILLVIDSTIGQNAIDQAKTFHQFTPLTGIVLTKLDGSAKGGVAIAIQKQLGIPIQWVGVGEKAEDLEMFDPESYVDALLNH